MALLKDHVLILKSISFSEADKILTVFGRNKGKYALIAKGVRKMESKNRGNIVTGGVSSITYYEGQNLGVLRESDLLLFPEIGSGQLEGLHQVLYLIYNLLPEGESDEELFNMVYQLYISQFTRRDVNRLRVRILKHLGYLPDMKSCSICGKSEDLTYVKESDLSFGCENCVNDRFETGEKWFKLSEISFESANMDAVLEKIIKKTIEG